MKPGCMCVCVYVCACEDGPTALSMDVPCVLGMLSVSLAVKFKQDCIYLM